MQREQLSAEDLRTAYERAMREPGISEVMRVHQHGLELQKTIAPYVNVTKRRFVISLASDSVGGQTLDRR